ncbi:hypothetical protein [Paraburkholderia sp. CNPSo 3281]|uniref:hypothetical protein n=1 Tax=Paraburkholderia sp. CNPSo 3281 TaxID=2940933 RepID=UPI002814CD60|nr:hypothetical protein [Paraburkholderia sp. CNPSo 3281]
MQKPMSIELVNEYGQHAVCVKVGGQAALLDAPDVDGLIEELSKLRALMQPAVPEQPLRSHQYVLEFDPCWYTERNPLFDGTVVFLRHTGLGWASFAIPTESMHRLKAALSVHEAAAQRDAHAYAQALPNQARCRPTHSSRLTTHVAWMKRRRHARRRCPRSPSWRGVCPGLP